MSACLTNNCGSIPTHEQEDVVSTVRRTPTASIARSARNITTVKTPPTPVNPAIVIKMVPAHSAVMSKDDVSATQGLQVINAIVVAMDITDFQKLDASTSLFISFFIFIFISFHEVSYFIDFLWFSC